MQRRHFEAIAEALRIARNNAINADNAAMVDPRDSTPRADTVDELIKSIADSVGQFNDNFKRERFLKACGLNA